MSILSGLCSYTGKIQHIDIDITDLGTLLLINSCDAWESKSKRCPCQKCFVKSQYQR